MPDQRLERGKATRERLVEAGRELFGAQGYEGTSIDAVLAAAGVKRGALYHHFESKQALFDAVLESVVSDIARGAANAARGESDPVESLRAGCNEWLRMSLDPAVQRIGLIDSPAVVGWTRWRELDEEYTLGGLKRNLELIAADGRLPADNLDVLAHMVLASVSEAALMIARADKPRKALASGQAAVSLLIDRLVSP